MNDKLFQILIRIIEDNIEFNTKIKELISDRNKTIAEALELAREELERQRSK